MGKRSHPRKSRGGHWRPTCSGWEWKVRRNRERTSRLQPHATSSSHFEHESAGCRFIKSAEIPIGIGGVSGLVTIHVLPSDMPLLLPVEFCRKMKASMDFDSMTCTWRAIHRTSQLFDEGSGGHFSVNIFEFPADGWRNPYEDPNPVRGQYVDRSIPIPRAMFELKAKSAML